MADAAQRAPALDVDGRRPAFAWAAALPREWLTTGQRLVLFALAADSYDGQTAAPGAANLAQWTGLWPSSVRAALDALAAPTAFRPALIRREDNQGGRRATIVLLRSGRADEPGTLSHAQPADEPGTSSYPQPADGPGRLGAANVPGNVPGTVAGDLPANDLDSPSKFFSNRNEQTDSYALADGAQPEEFEEALTKARAEGKLSRANVVRKVKGQPGPQTRDQRAEIIADMAAEGHHREQVARHLGITRETVGNIARDYGISFPADAVGKVRRIDPTRIVRETANTLEGLLLALPLVDVDALNPTEAHEWTASIDQSLRTLNRFNKKIKEIVR